MFHQEGNTSTNIPIMIQTQGIISSFVAPHYSVRNAGCCTKVNRWNSDGFYPSDGTTTQPFCTMKLNKQTKTVARSSNALGLSMPPGNSPLPNQDKFPSPPPQQPLPPSSADALDSPEQLQIRAFLQSNLPHFKASNTLLERIRHNIAED
ncbi:MAG: hypothetical protein IPL65_16885 [Lewinellaceae bacterium]|nr:hypothetical protein [Lewinellaceae bacterium]